MEKMEGNNMRMLMAICLLSGLALPAMASGCKKEAALKPIHDARLQAYFAAHRSIEAVLGE